MNPWRSGAVVYISLSLVLDKVMWSQLLTTLVWTNFNLLHSSHLFEPFVDKLISSVVSSPGSVFLTYVHYLGSTPPLAPRGLSNPQYTKYRTGICIIGGQLYNYFNIHQIRFFWKIDITIVLKHHEWKNTPNIAAKVRIIPCWCVCIVISGALSVR